MAVLVIQTIIILAMLGMIAMISYQVIKNKAKIFERFGTGFLIGLVTDFGDTLGIGSFATTTTLFRATHFINEDKKLPGTLNSVHAIPVLFEALLFITSVKVEMTTLIPMTTAAVLGALVGSRITRNWHTPTVQKVLAVTMFLAALVMIIRQITNPGENLSTAVHGLHGWMLCLGVVFNFILGNLMTMGLGNYAPELIFFSLVGVNPSIAFPVMMLDAALIMPAAAIDFIKTGRVYWKGFAGIVLGGIVGVFVAAKFVTSIDISALKIIIILLALWTSYALLRDSRVHKKELKR